MKYLFLMLFTMSALAGPAADRAKDVMVALKGGAVSNAQALRVVTAYVNQFSDQLPMTSVTTEVGEPQELQVCRDVVTIVRMQPDELTNEEKAQVFLNITKGWVLRAKNSYERKLKRESLRSEQAALDSQVQAVDVVDL